MREMAFTERPQRSEIQTGFPSREPLLALRGVSKRWAPDRPPVLDELQLELATGELVAVEGRNGIGKTTLLRVIAGLLVPDHGEVRLAGIDPERDRAGYNRRLGLLTAGNSGLYARLGVDEIIAFWAGQAMLPRARRRAAIADVLESFSLHDVRGRRVDRLSMGQRQRLRLALAFLHGPELVLLDEPSTSLDADGVAIIAAALDRHRTRGGAAIVCAPDSEQAPLGLDRTLQFADGRLREVDQ
jgi:heme ABC exporter ATP-binding subunit CcmA